MYVTRRTRIEGTRETRGSAIVDIYWQGAHGVQEWSSRIVRVGRGSGGVVASEVRQGRTRSGEASYMHDESFHQDPPGSMPF
jgi:hypothetical protein